MSYRYGSQGIRSRISPVNTVIILINIAVYIWLSRIGDPSDAEFMYNHGAAFWPDIVYEHQYYRLLTSAFIHFSVSHIFNNMLVLAFIGDNMERALGSVKYAIFYLLAALGSGVVSTVWDMQTQAYSVSGGASGAIFGVVGGMLVILIENRGRLEDLSAAQIALFAVMSVYAGITSVGVDNAAHIGGFFVGAIMALILYRKPGRGGSGRGRRGRHDHYGNDTRYYDDTYDYDNDRYGF